MSADIRRVEDFSCLRTAKAGFIPGFSVNYDDICVEIALGGKGNVISKQYYFKEENNLINQLPGARQEDKQHGSSPLCHM